MLPLAPLASLGRSCRSPLLLAGVTILVWVLIAVATAFASPVIRVYKRAGCPHCAQARLHLDALLQERPELTVIEHDVVDDPAALQTLRDLSARAGIKTPGVPTIVIGDTVLVGFEPDATPARIRAALGLSAASTPGTENESPAARGAIDLPVLGRIDVERLGLPLFTFTIGLLDGFNPCATWVLLFLLAMLVNLKSRARMALIAGTFVTVSGLVYYAFMAAWLTLFMVIGISQPVRIVLAVLALFVGAVNVKDFFAAGRGLSLSIPESAKPGIYRRVRSVLHAENLSAAMTGIVVLAFLVNLVELLCTAGLPALYTAVLTSQQLPTWKYHGYLALYILAYMLDDAVLVTIAVVTLSKRKLQESGGRWLKLLSGTVMFCLGAILLVKPAWLGF